MSMAMCTSMIALETRSAGEVKMCPLLKWRQQWARYLVCVMLLCMEFKFQVLKEGQEWQLSLIQKVTLIWADLSKVWMSNCHITLILVSWGLSTVLPLQEHSSSRKTSWEKKDLMLEKYRINYCIMTWKKGNICRYTKTRLLKSTKEKSECSVSFSFT